MKKLLSLLLLLAAYSYHSSGQQAPAITQTVRGTVFDKDSRSEMIGVAVSLVKDSSVLMSVASDVNGNYRFTSVPIGKYKIKANYLGYQPVLLSNIIVNSAKEVILNFDMEESAVQVKEVVVTATRQGEVRNEMATVSARTFSVEESNRYAGSRGDPARMASNFAGVQGADDSRNDIVIRGNSPIGVLWRLEGIDIPNPNHFAIAGSTGGPVSILNNKILENSDFFTGAFPAEYGNSIAGVFDLKMRNGNNEKHEFTGQFGFLGTELTAEGPLSKSSGASYLATYRYSTLKLFEAMNIKIGTNAVPSYQDGSFRVNFPFKKGGSLALFGIGGKSNIAIEVSKYTEPSEELYGLNNRDQYFATAMGVCGLSLSKPINSSSFFKLVLSASASESKSQHNLVYRSPSFALDSIVPKMRYRYMETKYSAHLFVNKKFNSRWSSKTGVTSDRYNFNMVDSNYNELTYRFVNRYDYVGSAVLIQPYTQFKYKPGDKLSFNIGLHGQYFTLNGSHAVEPRAGMRYTISPKQALSLGVGMHSQMMPTYVYFYHLPDNSTTDHYLHNKNVQFMKSSHAVISHDYFVNEGTHIKTEVYYQVLSGVPVEKRKSSFSLINQGVGFNRYFPDTLENKGTGTNYGLELTFEKAFSKSFFFLVSGSLFDSKYKGSDGIERNTDFNGTYAANFLLGKEIKFRDKKTLSFGTKVTAAGGHRFTPIDTAASRLSSDVVYVDSLRNTLKLKDYFRFDVKVNYTINTKRLTHELGLDLVNVLNVKNVLSLTYAPNPNNPSANPVIEEYQLGFLPLFYYKVDF